MAVRKVITPKVKKPWKKQGGMGLGVNIPKAVLVMSDKAEIAAEAGWRTAKELRALIGSGRTANGVKISPKQSTLDRRKRNMTPPKFRRANKTTGKIRGKSDWAKRYPYPNATGGRGSLGGDKYFVDSGLMASTFFVTLDGAPEGVALVSVNKKRVKAATILNYKHDVFTAIQPPLDHTVKRVVEKAARLDGKPDRLVPAILKAIKRGQAAAESGRPVKS